jgi:UDP-glucuronate decarboxylase
VNIGNPIERTICELVDLVLAMTGSTSEVTFQPLPVDDPKRRRPDITKAERVLGWRPTTSLEQGLRQTIAWFEANLGRRTPSDKRDEEVLLQA